MHKGDLIKEVAGRTSCAVKDTRAIIDETLAVIAEMLVQGEAVSLKEFGSFSVTSKIATTARNPRTGEPINIPERKVPKFIPALKLKEIVDRR